MRLTHGIDLVDIERFRRWLEDPRSKLRDRFTAKELANAAGAEEAVHLAGRFAAKEAVLKALRTGWAAGIEWTDVEVVRSHSGAPVLQLHGEAERLAAEQGLTEWQVSISHLSAVAIASVIAVGPALK